MSAYVENIEIHPLDPGAKPFVAPIPDANGRSTGEFVRVVTPPTCRVCVTFWVSEKIEAQEMVAALRKALHDLEADRSEKGAKP